VNTIRPLGTPIVRMGEVTSTMDIARRLESLRAAEGITIVAASQTHGRGRSARTWTSPPGAGLYCSVLLRPLVPSYRFRPFSIAAGLAVCEALDPNLHLGLRLKWPNDILYRDKKLAGILITSSLHGSIVGSAILGFGLNLLPDPRRPATATSLDEIDAGLNPNVQQLTKRILDTLSHRYTVVCNKETSAISDWPARLAFRNQPVRLQDGPTTITGILEGLDTSGALLVAGPRGTQTISAGELTRGPIPLDTMEQVF
jgi:BirA family biotin operon repressor/biotin-[acetyl-CoA-carboxylase] ligase